MIKPIFVKEKTLGDTWFQLLWDIYHHGRKTKITNGSMAGATRLEFDFCSGISMFPHQRPLTPIMPKGMHPVTTDEKIEEYFVDYLMEPYEINEGEHYKYAQWINKKMVNWSNSYKHHKNKAGTLDAKPEESQLEWVIRHFREKGYGNNHCYINVGDKDSNFAYDNPWEVETERRTSPCLRGLDFKIKDSRLITHVIYRSWDLYAGWPQNMGGFTLLNEYIAYQLPNVIPGPMAFSCAGLHCYDYQLENLKNVLHKEENS